MSRGAKSQTPEQLRQRCYDAHDGLYSYEEADFTHSKLKVKIRCPVHGLFEQQVIEHYKGRGCIRCSYLNSPIRTIGKKIKGTKVLDITGFRFGNENQLEVISCYEKAKTCYGYKHYVKCHNCAKDPEMYGDATFSMTRNNIFGRNVPCGCSRQYCYTEEQLYVIGKRFCKDKNIKFLGFDGVYSGLQTSLKFECLLDGHVWNKPYYSLYQDTGCWKCGRVSTGNAIRADEQEQANKLLAFGSYVSGTNLRRSSYNTAIWFLYCPDCQKEFKTHDSTLRRGFKPCYCGNPGGYDRTKDGHFYVLRAVSDGTEFAGYGITNVPKTRIRTHKLELSKKGFTLAELEIFEMSGENALELESLVKANFPLSSQDIPGFRTEATHYHMFDELIAYVELFLSESHSSRSNTV